MELKRKLYSGVAETLAELRRVAVICSSPNPDVEREILVQAGIRLDRFRNIPVVLFNHNPDWPIARCIEIGVVDGLLRAVVEFPPEGASARADEIYNLIKAGVITGVSIGFLPIETEPIDPKAPWGPQRYLQCELTASKPCSIRLVIPAKAKRPMRARAASKVKTNLKSPLCAAA